MEALVYHGPRELRLEEVPEPVPGAGEAVVAVAGCGVCGSDLHGYLGHSRARIPPLVLGHEASGRVLSLGEGVDEALLGKAVTVRPTLTCGRCEACGSGRDNLCRDRKLLGLNAQGALAGRVKMPSTNLISVKVDDLARASFVEVMANAVHVYGLAPILDSLVALEPPRCRPASPRAALADRRDHRIKVVLVP